MQDVDFAYGRFMQPGNWGHEKPKQEGYRNSDNPA
jgi:hypothetical protein